MYGSPTAAALVFCLRLDRVDLEVWLRAGLVCVCVYIAVLYTVLVLRLFYRNRPRINNIQSIIQNSHTILDEKHYNSCSCTAQSIQFKEMVENSVISSMVNMMYNAMMIMMIMMMIIIMP